MQKLRGQDEIERTRRKRQIRGIAAQHRDFRRQAGSARGQSRGNRILIQSDDADVDGPPLTPANNASGNIGAAGAYVKKRKTFEPLLADDLGDRRFDATVAAEVAIEKP